MCAFSKREKQRIECLFKSNGEWKEKRRTSRYSFFLAVVWGEELWMRSPLAIERGFKTRMAPLAPHHNQPLSFPTLFMCVGTVYVYRESRFFYFRLLPLMFPPSVSKSSIRGFESTKGISLSCGWSSYPIFLLKLRDFYGKKRKPQTSYVSQTNQWTWNLAIKWKILCSSKYVLLYKL